jgi:hypothetical protein
VISGYLIDYQLIGAWNASGRAAFIYAAESATEANRGIYLDPESNGSREELFFQRRGLSW